MITIRLMLLSKIILSGCNHNDKTIKPDNNKSIQSTLNITITASEKAYFGYLIVFDASESYKNR